MKKLNDIVGPHRKKHLPLSYAGKDNPEVDKLIHDHNVKQGHDKPVSNQLRLKLREDVEKHSPFSLDHLGTETQGHLPRFHYPTIKLHHLGIWDGAPTANLDSEKELYSSMPDTHYRGKLEPKFEEERAIRNYTNGSKELNQYLVGRHIGVRAPSPHHEEHLNNLLSVARQHRTTKPVSLWSGVGAAHPGKYKDGVYFPAFTSSSPSFSAASDFARTDRTDNPGIHPYVFARQHILASHAPMTILHPDVVRSAVEERPPSSWESAHDYKAHIFNHLMSHPDAQEYFNRTKESSLSYAVKPVQHILRIHAPAGSHLIYAGPWSGHPHERETIIPPGSKITHTGQAPDLYACGTIVHHVNLETPDLSGAKERSAQLRFQF